MDTIIELRHLRTLIALEETGSVSLAAQRVFLTQSALSHQIRLLENHFDTPLFERKSTPLRFTPAGERLLKLAHELLPRVAHAERDLIQIIQGEAGELRVAVECHTCFDWLMPAMGVFRPQWQQVELDIVSGFQADPVGLLLNHRADLAIVSETNPVSGISYQPLFAYEMLDLLKKVLLPQGINPMRRHSELTIAIIQLVASKRGIAALPYWTVMPYLEKNYVVARQIGDTPLRSELYAAMRSEDVSCGYIQDFCNIVRNESFANLSGLHPLDFQAA